MFTVVHQVSLKSLLLDRGLIVRSKGELSNQCDIVSPKDNIQSYVFVFWAFWCLLWFKNLSDLAGVS